MAIGQVLGGIHRHTGRILRVLNLNTPGVDLQLGAGQSLSVITRMAKFNRGGSQWKVRFQGQSGLFDRVYKYIIQRKMPFGGFNPEMTIDEINA
ncbi:MAG: hypothetical protein COB76_06455 [Alphaproteobacteria bacterium]|nr:MAG: hypothetical protein COB76_06455 [Alphaproteobacteria bacterium]